MHFVYEIIRKALIFCFVHSVFFPFQFNSTFSFSICKTGAKCFCVKIELQFCYFFYFFLAHFYSFASFLVHCCGCGFRLRPLSLLKYFLWKKYILFSLPLSLLLTSVCFLRCSNFSFVPAKARTHTHHRCSMNSILYIFFPTTRAVFLFLPEFVSVPAAFRCVEFPI